MASGHISNMSRMILVPKNSLYKPAVHPRVMGVAPTRTTSCLPVKTKPTVEAVKVKLMYENNLRIMDLL